MKQNQQQQQGLGSYSSVCLLVVSVNWALGYPVQVRKYPNKPELNKFTNAPSAFDPSYDQSIRNKSSMKNIKIINDSLNRKNTAVSHPTLLS